MSFKTYVVLFSDYDAVLTEAGDYTSKFFKLRQLFSMIIGNYTSKNQSTVLLTALNGRIV